MDFDRNVVTSIILKLTDFTHYRKVHQVVSDVNYPGCGSDLVLMPGDKFERLLKFYFDAKGKIDSKQ